MVPIQDAKEVNLNLALDELSENSVWKSWFPLTLKTGNTAIAKTTKPTPPNHWSIALHNNIPGVQLSKPIITVEPVVVIPDMDSKKESVKDNPLLSRYRGRAETNAVTNQLRLVKMNVCLMFNCFFVPLVIINKHIPKKIKIRDDSRKFCQ